MSGHDPYGDGAGGAKVGARRSPMVGESGYSRRDGEAYFTEPWATRVALRLGEIRGPVWECAAGNGAILDELRGAGLTAVGTDLECYGRDDIGAGLDFLAMRSIVRINARPAASIMTNPPYDQIQAFIRHALVLTKPTGGQVIMLLRNEYDCGHKNGRGQLFQDMPFWRKIVLTRRPYWSAERSAGPRHNYAWYIWDWARGYGADGRPVRQLFYGE